MYPTFSSNWLSVAPFTNPEFTHYRMTEFVDKGLQNLVGYIVPDASYYLANTDGCLEWAWNAHGRSADQFATSWATRQGVKDPAKFVAWTKLIDPPAWDMYASSFPYVENWGAPLAKIASGKKRYDLGKSIFAEFKTADKFATNIAQCREGLNLAQELGEPQFIHESAIVLDYSQVLQSVWELSQVMRGEEDPLPENRAATEQWLRQCQAALDTLSVTYPAWSEACNPALKDSAPGRFTDTVNMMDKFGSRIGELMERQGLVDEGKLYRVQTIGSWKTEDFKLVSAVTRRMEVSPLVMSAGTRHPPPHLPQRLSGAARPAGLARVIPQGQARGRARGGRRPA